MEVKNFLQEVKFLAWLPGSFPPPGPVSRFSSLSVGITYVLPSIASILKDIKKKDSLKRVFNNRILEACKNCLFVHQYGV
jgi:hypothetical protein